MLSTRNYQQRNTVEDFPRIIYKVFRTKRNNIDGRPAALRLYHDVQDFCFTDHVWPSLLTNPTSDSRLFYL